MYRSFFVRIRSPCSDSSVLSSDSAAEELLYDRSEVAGGLPAEPPFSFAPVAAFDFPDQKIDLFLPGVGRDFLLHRHNRPLDFPAAGVDPFPDVSRGCTVRESLGHHVPIPRFIGGEADAP